LTRPDIDGVECGMHIKVIARIAKIVWTRFDRYRAEIMFYNGPKKVYWMSKKQGEKVKSCAGAMDINSFNHVGRVVGVFDNDRFVWCGCIRDEPYEEDSQKKLHNDLPYLREHFKVKDEDVDLYTSPYPPSLEVPAIVEVDKELMDEA